MNNTQNSEANLDNQKTNKKVGETILLVYDKECPACDNYCRLVNIRESVGELVLVNARSEHPVMQEITDLGWDIDDGMVLKVGQTLFYGADAIHALSLIGSDKGAFNRLNHYIFKSRRLSSILYPVLKSMRAVMLKILRVSKINNLKLGNNEKF